MQVNNQDLAVRQYAQATQSAKATVANSANAEVSQVAPEASAVKPDVDRVELSKDTDITKMSESDRNKLVDSLKADLDNQMSRFTNMMVQTFQKQGITAASLQGDG